MICDDKHSNSIQLPSDLNNVPCRGCGRGEFFNKSKDECSFC